MRKARPLAAALQSLTVMCRMDLNKGQEPNWGQYQQLVLDFGKLKEVGAGNERRCFIDPKEPGLLYKLSRPGRSRQTRREIAYFSFLKRRGVPFSHIPEFYGAFRCQEGIGLLQEFLISNELYFRIIFLQFMLNIQ